MELAGRGFAHDGNQLGLGAAGHVADGADHRAVELAGGRGSDAPELFSCQRMEEGRLAAGIDDLQSVRLRRPARHLRDDLARPAADGDGQAHPPADLAAKVGADLGRRAPDVLHAADVEERLLERNSLYHGRDGAEDLEELAARLRVVVEARVDGDEVGAEVAGPRAAHPAADSEGPRLIARGHHHPGPDDRRAASQARIVALRNRREERICIGVKDRWRSASNTNICSHHSQAVARPCVRPTRTAAARGRRGSSAGCRTGPSGTSSPSGCASRRRRPTGTPRSRRA